MSLPTVVEITESDEDVVWSTPLYEDGTAVDLVSGDAATLRYRRADGTGVEATVAASIDTANNLARFTLPADATSVPAGRREVRYFTKVRLVTAGGSTRHYPSRGYDELVVSADP